MGAVEHILGSNQAKVKTLTNREDRRIAARGRLAAAEKDGLKWPVYARLVDKDIRAAIDAGHFKVSHPIRNILENTVSNEDVYEVYRFFHDMGYEVEFDVDRVTYHQNLILGWKD